MNRLLLFLNPRGAAAAPPLGGGGRPANDRHVTNHPPPQDDYDYDGQAYPPAVAHGDLYAMDALNELRMHRAHGR